MYNQYIAVCIPRWKQSSKSSCARAFTCRSHVGGAKEFDFHAFFPFACHRTGEFGCDIFCSWNPKAVTRVEIFIPQSSSEIYGTSLAFLHWIYLKVVVYQIKVFLEFNLSFAFDYINFFTVSRLKIKIVLVS